MRKAPKIVIPKNLEDMPPIVDPAYISELFKIGYDAILRILNSGEIKGKKVCGFWRIRREDVIAYVSGIDINPKLTVANGATKTTGKVTARPILVRRVRRKKRFKEVY